MSRNLFKVDYYVLSSEDAPEEEEMQERVFYITEDHIHDILEQQLKNNQEYIDQFYVTKV